MADTKYNITRVVFDTEPELTQVYMFIHAWNDVPIGVEGWHHKTFPKSKSTLDVLNDWAEAVENPLLWPQQAPPASPPIYED
jgi:hypothetical protein